MGVSKIQPHLGAVPDFFRPFQVRTGYLDRPEEGESIWPFGLAVVPLGLVKSQLVPTPSPLGLLAVPPTVFLVPLPLSLLLWRVSGRFGPIPTVSGLHRVSKRATGAPKRADNVCGCGRPQRSQGIVVEKCLWPTWRLFLVPTQLNRKGGWGVWRCPNSANGRTG